MPTPTIQRFEVETAASKNDRRTVTVAALDAVAARAAAVANHRSAAGLPATASILAVATRPVTDPVPAPRPMSKAEIATMLRNRRDVLDATPDDAA